MEILGLNNVVVKFLKWRWDFPFLAVEAKNKLEVCLYNLGFLYREYVRQEYVYNTMVYYVGSMSGGSMSMPTRLEWSELHCPCDSHGNNLSGQPSTTSRYILSFRKSYSF